MSTASIPVSTMPTAEQTAPTLYRISVEQYHEMIRNGILTDGDKVELIEGVLVQKMGKNPPHRFVNQLLGRLLVKMLPDGWFADLQESLTTTDSVTESDLAIFRGDPRAFLTQNRHPGPEDTAIVMEVSDSTLAYDSGTKKRVYAQAGIAEYWIINLVDRRVEVYTKPIGPGASPTYQQRQDYGPGSEVPVRLDGQEVGRIRVDELFL